MSFYAASQRSSDFAGDRDAFYKDKPKYEYTPKPAYYDENGVFVCGFALHPFENLRLDQSRERDPLQKRIGRWLREIGRAEGYDIPPHEDDVQPEEFTGFVWREGPTTNAWLHAVEETGHLDPDPLADEVMDPKLARDFKFVQKRASKRKMSELESRRLHIVFRASTEEKIKRIKDICESLLPLIVGETHRNDASVGMDDDRYEQSQYYEHPSVDDSYDGNESSDPDDYSLYDCSYSRRYQGRYNDDPFSFSQKSERVS